MLPMRPAKLRESHARLQADLITAEDAANRAWIERGQAIERGEASLRREQSAYARATAAEGKMEQMRQSRLTDADRVRLLAADYVAYMTSPSRSHISKNYPEVLGKIIYAAQKAGLFDPMVSWVRAQEIVFRSIALSGNCDDGKFRALQVLLGTDAAACYRLFKSHERYGDVVPSGKKTWHHCWAPGMSPKQAEERTWERQ